MIDSFYEGKTLLVTGTTGFVGKVLIEKLLFSLPQIKRIFLFIRPRKGSSIQERFRKEIIESPCFDRLRDMHPKIFSEKVFPIGGDMLKDPVVLDPADESELIENVNVVINSAASVDFNQRLDLALQINTLGTLRVINLAKKFKHLKAFVQISTAYVNSDKPEGWIEEKVYPISRNPSELLEELLSLTPEQIELKTPEYIGTYPNTYTYTKNLTEQLLKEEPNTFPLCIVRPTIIGGAMRYPFPGWVDTVSAAGAMYLTVGLGLLHFMYGHSNKISDQVPVDMVVNTVICAAALYCKPWSPLVVHSGTSSRNPITWESSKIVVLSAWKKFPLEKAVGKPSFKMTTSKLRYKAFKFINRTAPLAAFKNFANLTNIQSMKKKAMNLEKLMKKEKILLNAFDHFVSNEWIFSGQNMIAMQRMMTPDEISRFEFDPSKIDWTIYLANFACGIKRYVLKEEIYTYVDAESTDLNWEMRPESRFFDIYWAYKGGNNVKYRGPTEMKSLILKTPHIQQKILDLANKDPNKKNHDSIKEINSHAQSILNTIICEMRMPVIRVFAWVMRKIWRLIYEKVVVDQNALERYRQFANNSKAPIVIVPTSRSYIDFLIVSYVLFAYKINLPHVAVNRDSLKMTMLNYIFRWSGAIFIKKATGDDLYSEILKEYMQQLLRDSQILEIFVEGTRSRSGKSLPPKLDLLSICTDTYFSQQVPDVLFVPVTINYERVLEAEHFLLELVGENKPQESWTHMVSYMKILKENLGKIYIIVGESISLKEFSGRYQGSPSDITQVLGNEIIYKLQDNIVIMATAIVSAILLMHRRVLLEDEIVKKVEWIRGEIEARKYRIGGIEVGGAQIAVNTALSHFKNIITYRKDLFQPSVCVNPDYKSILLLSYYRNSLIHVFAAESLVICTLYSFGEIIALNEGISEERLVEETAFLAMNLENEFISRECLYEKKNILKNIEFLIKRGTFQIANNKIKLNNKSEIAITFFCSLIWPIIDTYWGTLMFCSAFRKRQAIPIEKLQQNLQWFMENMYEERTISFYDSCSVENISNALKTFEKKGILKRGPAENLINLDEELFGGEVIEDLLVHLEKFRKTSLVKKVAANHELRSALLSEFPELPKL